MKHAQPVSEVDRAIGARVHQFAWLCKVEQLELGRVLGGLSPAATSRKIHGITRWHAEELLRVAQFFGIEPGELLTGLTPTEQPHRVVAPPAFATNG